MKKVYLTYKPPILIDEDAWPRQAMARDSRHVLVVRRSLDGQWLVYGMNWAAGASHLKRCGYLMPASTTPADAANQLSHMGALERFPPELVRKCLQRLPAEYVSGGELPKVDQHERLVDLTLPTAEGAANMAALNSVSTPPPKEQDAMSLTVIQRDVNDREGKITIQGDTMEEVSSLTARNLALKEAAVAGLSRPGVSGNAPAYPVDAEGQSTEDVIMGRTPVAGYRCDYPVTAGI